MAKYLLSVTLTGVLFCASALSNAQCDPVMVGTYNGSPAIGNEFAPFATNTSSNIRRGARTQYIFRADELTSAGLCPGNIVGLTLEALQSDITGPGPDGITGTADDFLSEPGLLVDVRMAHSNLAAFVDESDQSLLPLDQNVMSQYSIHLDSLLPIHIAEGPLHFALAPDSFFWDGTSNVVIDLAWLRSAVNGLSPQFKMTEELGFACTRWVQTTQGTWIQHGRSLTDQPLPLQASTGINERRPVITFFSVGGLATTIGEPDARDLQATWDAQASVVLLSSPSPLPSLLITCHDTAGRLIVQHRTSGGELQLRIPVTDAASGPIFLNGAAEDGTVLLQKVMVRP